jgi:acetylglutamate kinase
MRCVVVKVGGHALDSLASDASVLMDLASDIAEIRNSAGQVVVVHGGGPQIAALLGDVGLEGSFHDGLRITDNRTMQYVVMALSNVNASIVAALNHAGVASVGLSGVDGQLMQSESIGEPFDRVGLSPRVRRDVIDTLWGANLTPVVCPFVADSSGQLLNCNADAAAGALAGALGAEVLVLLSDVDQLRADPDDPQSIIASVTSTQIEEMKRSGAVREGMLPKMSAALHALEGGAHRIVMANGTRSHALRGALAGSIPTTEVLQ